MSVGINKITEVNDSLLNFNFLT